MGLSSVTRQLDPDVDYLSKCPLCNAKEWKVLSTPGNWIGQNVFGRLHGMLGLVRCRNCRLIFTNPRPSSERLREFYSGDDYCCHDATSSASVGAKAEFILKRISDLLPSNLPRNLLDFGAGGGGFLAHASKSGWEVRGFEPGKRGLDNCRQAGLEATDKLEELLALKFSVITLHHVFEHLPNPADVLSKIRGLIAPGGLLFVEVPNVNSLRAKIALPFFSQRFRIDERYRAFPIHLMYYNEATLRRILHSGGWRPIKTFTLGIGLEEFLVPRTGKTSLLTTTERVLPKPKRWRRIRRTMRDAFLASGFGENLAAISQPHQ
jgi:SAM-dependent methyltransferase